MQKQLAKSCKTSLTAIENDRKAIDKAIDKLIEGDQQLKQLFALMTSIPGMGTATATEVVIATNELQTITDPKKMAASAVRLSRQCRTLQLPIRK
jgi:transposase